ncbi:MAG: pyruvate dehydrogenase complex E1 component subunit beta [Ardenticatenia bacterium]|nr:pyruvate dehydrogenase complex E1 component subunit beta [Ardenticatenia bacterium]
MAAARRLPVVFVLENNQWALSTPVHKHTALRHLVDRARGYGIPGVRVDGNDVVAVYRAAQEAVERARNGEGPTLIEAVTMRMAGHSVTDPAHYVPSEMWDEWAVRDPIERFRHALRQQGMLSEEDEARLEAEIEAEIEDAVAFALASPLPRPEQTLEGVFALSDDRPAPPTPTGTERQLTYRAAIREALFEAMRADERVVVLGEDVEYGGVYGITKGMLEAFGPRRVVDTPIAETAIVGAATGAALFGMRPVAEIQFADFIASAMDELVNMTAKYHYRTEWPVPLVIRAPSGAIIDPHGSTGPFHSQSPEAWFAHTPGLKVVVPATPYDAKGLLLAAIEDPNPVLFFEQKALYHRQGSVPAGYYTVPLGQATLRREGEDVSIVAYGAMVVEALAAAEMLAGEGIDVEVVDVRTLVPLDEETVLNSARKTGKVLVVHEANRTAGFGAELAARIVERAFEWLDAPVVRLTSPDTPTPSVRPLATFWYPNARRIAAAARELAAY